MYKKEALKPQFKLPLTSDIVFKRFFSKQETNNILRNLLESILNIKIKKVLVINPKLPKNIYDTKDGILDIKVEIDDNIICDIFMQLENKKSICQEYVNYMPKILSKELQFIDKYNSIKKVIIINIMNFEYFKTNDFHNITYFKNLEIHFIELPKFERMNKLSETDLEQWLWFIIGREDKIEMMKNENEEIKKAEEIKEKMNIDAKEWEMYKARQIAIWEYNTCIYQAKMEGIEIGKINEKINIAKQLLKVGMKTKEIQQITKLSIEDIKKLDN